MEYYTKVCSVEKFLEEPDAPCLYDDMKYYLIDEDGSSFGLVFHFLKHSRNGSRIYYIGDGDYPCVIEQDDLEEFKTCYIAKRSNEISEIELVWDEFKPNGYADDSRDWKLAKEVVRLRNIIKSKETVVNNVVQNIQTTNTGRVYSDRTPIDGFDPNKPWSWVCNGCGSREYSEALSERDMDALACSECGDDEWHKEND